MGTERSRVAMILDGAMALLRERGDHGLTMRKVAEAAGISLGHLQHYFATRNDVLEALVGSHFAQCTQALQRRIREHEAAGPQARVACLVALGLDYVGDDDRCRISREFWALSSRNADVRAHLDAYYREYAELITAFLTPVAASREAAHSATALLMPWFEGYNVTARSIALDPQAMADQLGEFVLCTLRPPGSR